EIGEDELEEVVDRALFENEAAIHIGFADGERRVENEQPLGRAISDASDNGRAIAVAKIMGATVGVDQAQITCRNDPIKGMPERAEHRTKRQPSERKGFQ